MKTLKFIPGLLVALLPLIAIVEGASADTDKFNLAVDCRCTDSVGKQFCAEVKDTISSSPDYRLSSGNSGYGIGLHFRCVDLWVGIEKGLVGRMSAVSVAFTIYSDKLPGEVYEDSSVFRVGKDATGEMSRKIIDAIGQLITVNQTLFQHLREAEKNPSPSPSP